MTDALFRASWTVRSVDDPIPTPVVVPHDAMIGEARSGDASTGTHGGFFPGGRYVYAARFEAPDATRRPRLLFEGVLGLASADPSPLLPYTGDRVRTHRGRALAVILVEGDGGPVGADGGGTLRVTSDRHGETRIAF